MSVLQPLKELNVCRGVEAEGDEKQATAAQEEQEKAERKRMRDENREEKERELEKKRQKLVHIAAKIAPIMAMRDDSV